MARDSRNALVALNRFGFGARGGASGDFVNAASDPRGFVKAELARPGAILLEVPGLQSTQQLAKAVFDYQFEQQQARAAAAKPAAPATEAAPQQPATDARPPQSRSLSLANVAQDISPKEQPVQPAASSGTNGATASAETMRPGAAPQPNPPKPAPPQLNVIQKTFRAEALARLQRATLAECGFAERLVVFWSNHFCISANKGGLARMWAGSFEREAIRPHVLGRFADMLNAVEQHPAMLFFLDNQQSLGPDSRAGINRQRGLNENLAREIMELHTLGVDGGYTQDDVTSLARIITGWTFAGRQGVLGTPGSFVFNANAHEPGAQRVLGKVYEANGLAQGEAALSDIARHPSTARFIAAKFARHFVADDPPPAWSRRLPGRLHKNGRRSAPLARRAGRCGRSLDARRSPRCARLTNIWSRPGASSRACPMIPAAISAVSICSASRLWSPAGPNGFPDTNAAWASPEGMKLRLDIAAQHRPRLPDSLDPRDLLELAAADAASEETRRTIERAEIAAAGDGDAVDVAGIPEEMTMDCREGHAHFRRRGARSCSAAPRSPPGRTCRNSRAPRTAAIRG